MASYTLRRNADGTVTFRAGRYVETFSATDKTEAELADALRWAAIAAGINVEPEDIAETARQLRE